MASTGHAAEQALPAPDVRLVVDAIPTLAWSARSDGSADFFNQRWLDYTGLSIEQACDWGWTGALHSDDLNRLVDYWRCVLASTESGEIEGRLRRFDGVYRWFLFRATPSFDNDGRVVKWFGTNTDIEDRKRAECLLGGENLVLEMTAKGNSLESILETLCRVVDQTASGCHCSVMLIDPNGSKIQQVVAPSLPSSYNDRFPGTPVDREGGPCTKAARGKTQVIVSDVTSDTQWDTYGWRTAALRHGLKACWSTSIVASNGLVLGNFAIYWREPRSPTEQDQEIIEQMTHLAAVAIEHKRSETALQESEEHFRLIVNTIPGFVCTLSAAGEVELLNRQVLEYFGKTTEELKNWAMSDAVHADDLPRVVEAWKRSVETGEPYDLEFRQRRADGVYRWFQSRALPTRDTKDRITGWYMVLTDIDDRRRAEDALRASEQDFRLIVDTIPGLVWTMTAAGEVELVNKQMMDYFGTPLDELKEWARFLHPDDCDRVIANWGRIIESGQPYEVEHRLRRADGVYRWFQARGIPQRDREGRIVRWYNLLTDIDEGKRAEDALRSNEQSLRLTVDSIPGFVSTMSAAGEAEFVSRQVLEYFGKTIEELKDWATNDTLHPDDRPRMIDAWKRAIETGQPFDLESRRRRADGVYRWFHLRSRPQRDAAGRIVRWYNLTTDIEGRKRAEALLAGEKRLLEMLASESSMSGILEALCQLVESTVSGCYCSIVLVDPSGTRLEHGAAPSLPASFTTSIIGRPVNVESGPCAMAAYLNEQVIAADLRLETRWAAYEWCPMALAHGLQACWSTPISSTAGKVLGAFAIYYDEPRTPTDLQQSLIERFTHIASIAVERAQGDAALKRSEAFLTDAQHLSRTGSFGCKVATGEMAWSEETFRIFGYDRTTKPAVQAILERIHPEDKAMVGEAIDRGTKEGKDCDLEYRLLLPDDSVKHVHVVAHAVNDESGRIEFVGAVMDVTEQWRARTELEKAFEENKRLKDRLHDENVALREQIDQAFMFEEIVGSSPALKTVLSGIVKVAPTDSTVLITGETGTGKELIARAIHKGSQRARQAFITVNCASIPSSLIASELFGHEKGAFTGAVQRRQGRFELAHSGTIFLDEIGELPAETQIALLRVLQERQFERVGGSRLIPTDVRVIAATNRDLAAAIDSGTFRADLFYRLNVFPIHVPPLRQRKEDIPMLVEYFVKRYAEKARKQISKIDKNTLKLCQSYHWPGNIRELQNIIERSVILCTGDTLWIDESWLSSQDSPRLELSGPLTQNLRNYEKELIEAALAESNGKVAGPNGAAAKLGIPRSTLDLKIKQLNIKKQTMR